MRVIKLLVISCLITFLLGSCGLIFDNDLSKEEIKLIAPQDSAVVEGNDQTLHTFWWEANDQIETYRFQVVSPDFENPSIPVLDTLVTQTTLKLNLEQRKFQWRVRGENSVNNLTSYCTRTFTVDTLKNIRGEIVQVRTPTDGQEFDEGDPITLSWDNIQFANKYVVTITSQTAVGKSVIYDNVTTNSFRVTNSDLYEFIDELPVDEIATAEYQFTVVAVVSQENQTKVSAVRSFSVLEKTN